MSTEIRPRRRLSAEDRREQILDLTHAIVDAEGFHAATLNRIAADAGVTRTVIYQQFGDLAGLFIALVDREAARATAQFEASVAAPEGHAADDPLERTFTGVLAAIDAHPATWRLFLCPPEGAPPELHEHLAKGQAGVRRYLSDALVQINPRLPDPEYTAHILHAAGREMLRLRLTDPSAATHERLLGHVRRFAPHLLPSAG